MSYVKTLRFKISSVFFLILLIILFILFYGNLYAMNVVRSQVAESYRNMFSLYGKKVDNSLDEVRNYLVRTIINSADNVDIIEFNNNPKGSSEYYYSTINIVEKFQKDSSIFFVVDTLFVYSEKNDDAIVWSVDFVNEYYERNKELMNILHNLPDNRQWKIVRIGNEYELINMIGNGTGSYIGALVSMKRLMALEDFLKFSNDAGTIIMSNEGRTYFSSDIELASTDIVKSAAFKKQSGYQIIKSSVNANNYLVCVNKPSRIDIIFIEALDEKMLLKDLTFFRFMIYIIPIGMVFIVIMYLLSLQRLLFNPVEELQKGIRNIIHGDLTVNLTEKGASELRLVIRTFNDMVSQIHNLKIDVYEEQLKAQNKELEIKEVELNNLQLRIKPHFFSNSLNIIYSLATLKDYKAIQNMALLLSKYFRYIIQTRQAFTELRNEIDYVRNYLEIQKIRFTEKLRYDIFIDDQFLSYRLPDLIIQPFVENSIIHGFMDREEPLHIVISVGPDPDEPGKYINIRIADNGKGFSGEESINFSNPEFLKSNEQHIGISNIYNRIEIIYEKAAKVFIHNGKDGGAIIDMHLPLGTKHAD